MHKTTLAGSANDQPVSNASVYKIGVGFRIKTSTHEKAKAREADLKDRHHFGH